MYNWYGYLTSPSVTIVDWLIYCCLASTWIYFMHTWNEWGMGQPGVTTFDCYWKIIGVGNGRKKTHIHSGYNVSSFFSKSTNYALHLPGAWQSPTRKKHYGPQPGIPFYNLTIATEITTPYPPPAQFSRSSHVNLHQYPAI